MTTLTDTSTGPDETLPQHLRALFADVLARHSPERPHRRGDSRERPERPGDSQVIAAKVTAALWELGVAATTVDVTGWTPTTGHGLIDDVARKLFHHRATLAGGWLLDAAAQRVHAGLPACWIAPVPDYLRELAAATGAEPVTLSGGGT